MMEPSIDILLATYNAEPYLADQLDSLSGQTKRNWRLLVRDDGSSDHTLTILDSFKTRYPEKITILKDNLGNLGACRNFARLMEQSTADYIMFCDQDDVWLPDKIDVTYQRMKGLATEFGNELPLLVCSDMKVVDHDLRVVANSYWGYQAMNPKRGMNFSRLLVSNVIIGCTVMVNKKLRDLALPLPPEALMHDWWAGLVAVAFGRVDFLEEPTVLYRQHTSNVVGATWDMSPGGMMRKLRDMKQHKEFLLQSQQQAGAFADRFGKQLPEDKSERANIWAGLNRKNWFVRRYAIVRHGLWWSGLLRDIALMSII